jgi:hypothetical protein
VEEVEKKVADEENAVHISVYCVQLAGRDSRRNVVILMIREIHN